MDKNFALPRRIWRILYPPLIFIGMQVVVIGIACVVYAMIYAIQEAAGGIDIQDAGIIIDEAMQFVSGHSMVLLLVSDIICFAGLLPIWLKTRKRIESYKNINPIVVCILTIGLFAAVNIVQMVIFTLTNVMDYFPSYKEISEVLITDSFAVQLIAIGIAAPMVEELIFRAILISRMQWLPIWASVLIQGVLFGVVHLNLFQGLYAFIAGILLGMVFVKYRSLPIVITGHMAYNLASLLVSEFASDSSAGMVVVLSVLLLPVCTVFIIKHKKAVVVAPGYGASLPPVYAPANMQSSYYAAPTGPWPPSPPTAPQTGYDAPTRSWQANTPSAPQTSNYAPTGPWPASPPTAPQSGNVPTGTWSAGPPKDPWTGFHPADPWTNNDKAPRR